MEKTQGPPELGKGERGSGACRLLDLWEGQFRVLDRSPHQCYAVSGRYSAIRKSSADQLGTCFDERSLTATTRHSSWHEGKLFRSAIPCMRFRGPSGTVRDNRRGTHLEPLDDWFSETEQSGDGG